MFKVDDLILLSGNDIPFESAQLIIHQPTIKEIALIGEENFFIGCQMLNFSKKILSIQDNSDLSNKSDFDIFMSIMMDKNKEIQIQQVCATLVLSLMFPSYQIKFQPNGILFFDEKNKGHYGSITQMNFDEFKKILVEMFCLQSATGEQEYNPGGKLAQKLVDKFNERHRKLAQLKGEQAGAKKIAVLGRYISILTVGTHKNLQSFLDYTIYQLFDEHRRFELKMQYDIYFKAKLAGAKDMKEPEDWMKDIHDGSLA